MTEQEFLQYILKEIEKKSEHIREKIGDVNKDMVEMNEYFWENFNEFDEYGYEEYDNQSVYLMRSRERDTHFDELKRCRKMLDSPYFGKISFVYEGEEEAEDFYIGIGNFWREEEMVPVIFDWRAPVSSLFYDYEKGEAGYEAPSGFLKGEIITKKQFKIKHGKMIYELNCDIKIDDDILRSELAKNTDRKLRSIVTSIQKEQNAIIRNKEDKILVIQGCAGSGKTSIALHRIAYLLYHNRKTLNAGNVLILSPNGVFADYISHILPELGEENINEMSFDHFAYRELKEYGETEEIYDFLEHWIAYLRIGEDVATTYAWRVKNKQSGEMIENLNEFVLKMEMEYLHFRALRYNGIEKSADEMADLFYLKFPDLPLMKRKDVIAEYLIDEIETLRGRDFEQEEIDIVHEKLKKMYRSTNLWQIYQDFLEEYGYERQGERNGIILYEDVYPMIYLKYLLWGKKHLKEVRHVVIDEMQDYSPIQYELIREMFQCPMTILGDKAQSMTEKNHDVRATLKHLFGREMKEVELKKSYRSTMEIMEYASGLTGEKNAIPFDRHGEVPACYTYPTQNEKYEALIEQIRREQSAETKAVLVLEKDRAYQVAQRLKEAFGDRVCLLDKESSRFRGEIIVTTYYIAKGLEFDAVYVADAEDPIYQMEFGKQAMYVCATRALHSLRLYRTEEALLSEMSE